MIYTIEAGTKGQGNEPMIFFSFSKMEPWRQMYLAKGSLS